MRRIVRVAGWTLATVAILMGVTMIAARAYFSSAGAKRLASDKLSAQVGVPVVVKRLTTGLTGTTTLGVELPASPGIGAGTDPVLTGTLVADVSVLGLALGKAPTSVTVEDATLTLHFDRGGNLLDKLPEPTGEAGDALPKVILRRATIRLIQEGRPDFRAAGIEATLTPNGDRLTLTGSVDDVDWGSWVLDGDLAADGSTGDMKLTTAGIAKLGMRQLRSLPAVSPVVWEVIELDGETTGTVRLYRPTGGEWAYQVLLSPRGTRLGILPTGLTVTDASAQVGIEGLVVTIAGLKGRYADGNVTADAVGDFGQQPEVITLNVSADGVDVTLLPRKWTAKLPPLDQGRLRTTAELTLRIKGGDVETQGRGTGHVSGQFLGGTAEVDVELVGDGESLEFRPPAKAP